MREGKKVKVKGKKEKDIKNSGWGIDRSGRDVISSTASPHKAPAMQYKTAVNAISAKRW